MQRELVEGIKDALTGILDKQLPCMSSELMFFSYVLQKAVQSALSCFSEVMPAAESIVSTRRSGESQHELSSVLGTTSFHRKVSVTKRIRWSKSW